MNRDDQDAGLAHQAQLERREWEELMRSAHYQKWSEALRTESERTQNDPKETL
jgi:hypothetical protein